ncbi:MAG TPA: methyltransferase [Rugosimonospora sp.]|nr:methyltransferase [Rugosimonospora sp.]
MTSTEVRVPVDAASVKRLANGFCTAKILLTGAELGLFETLAAGPATESEIVARLGLNGRGLRDFLGSLVALGLLLRSGEQYANTEIADRFLARAGGEYLGGFLHRADAMLYPVWGRLGDALRTGEPQVADAGDGSFGHMIADPARLRQFLGMMDAMNGPVAGLLADAFDWSQYRSFADIGGARGNLAARLVTARPHLSATVFDLPEMAEPFAEHMDRHGTAASVLFTGGDFFADPLPSADVLIFGHVLHDWSAAQNAALLANAYESVPVGGAVLVYDAMLDPDVPDLARMLVSLNMLLVTARGAEYPVADCRDWYRLAGFTDVTARPLGANDTLVIGYRRK